MTTINFTDEHLNVLRQALDLLYRIKAGQLAIAISDVFPEKNIGYDERLELERVFNSVVHPELTAGSAYGCTSKEIGDAKIAYEIYQTIRQYQSVTNNGGYFGAGRDSDDPLKVSGEPLPEIENFNKFIDVEIPKKLIPKLEKAGQGDDVFKMWEIINEGMILPRSEERRIIYQGDTFVAVRCFKPRR